MGGIFRSPGMVGLQQGLSWLGARRELISQNLANADTPGYQPLDARPAPAGSFGTLLSASTGATAGGGAGPATGAGVEVVAASDGPQRLDGNGVNVDAEMARLAQTQLWYAADAKTLEMAFARLRTAMG